MNIEKKINKFVEAGAMGFILRDCKIEDFLNTIASVASGKEVVPCHREVLVINKKTKKIVPVKQKSEVIKRVKMTKRERQVIGLISNGMANKDISKLLHLSAFKLKNHVHDIFEKVARHSRAQADDK